MAIGRPTSEQNWKLNHTVIIQVEGGLKGNFQGFTQKAVKRMKIQYIPYTGFVMLRIARLIFSLCHVEHCKTNIIFPYVMLNNAGLTYIFPCVMSSLALPDYGNISLSHMQRWSS